jgi:transcriptional regulator with XRE-family HTH domain
MPAIAPRFDPTRVDVDHGHAAALMCDDLVARLAMLKQAPTMYAITPSAKEAPLPTVRAADPGGLPARIQQLIELEGGVCAIAERCGFSEGSVRNWRDGRSDPSRERCVTMAQVLGVSLVWLVAGEGSMKADAGRPAQPSAEASVPTPPEPSPSARMPGLDSKLLASALRLLQSYIGLIGGSLDSNARADRVAELYDILKHSGDAGLAGRLITFHHTLSTQLRRNRALIA